MKKFWEWMKKKGYGFLNIHNELYFKHINTDNSLTIDEPTKQMLIGYMEEYLWNKYKVFVGISTSNAKIKLNFIEQRFEDLKILIEWNDKTFN